MSKKKQDGEFRFYLVRTEDGLFRHALDAVESCADGTERKYAFVYPCFASKKDAVRYSWGEYEIWKMVAVGKRVKRAKTNEKEEHNKST